MFKNIIFLLFISVQLILANSDLVFRIMATANVHNETDPCGWKKKPLGGLARKATVLDEASIEADNFFVVDAGNLFFKAATIPDAINLEISQINAEIILESFNSMGCNAFSPGSFDFAAGLSYLQKLEKMSNFPFVSCNILDNDNNLLFKPYVIEKVENYNVAFIGLASSFDSENVVVGDQIEYLLKVLQDLEGKSDFNVLLFNSNDSDLSTIYNQKFNVDLIIRSKDKKRSSDGGSQIPTFSLGDRGKIIYQFDINVKDLNEELVDLAWCENTIKRVESRLEKMKKGDLLIDLRELYKDNQATLRRIDSYENQLLLANQKIENVVNSLTFDKIELSKTIADRIDILKIVDEGKVKLNSLSYPALPDHKGRLPGDPHYNHGH